MVDLSCPEEEKPPSFVSDTPSPPAVQRAAQRAREYADAAERARAKIQSAGAEKAAAEEAAAAEEVKAAEEAAAAKRAAEAAARVAEERTAAFSYDKPWHRTADSCRQHGCPLRHVKLQDFKPHAQSQDRGQLRKAVRFGTLVDGARRCIVGTVKVPKEGEPGQGSARSDWWWHEGDPHLAIAKQLMR